MSDEVSGVLLWLTVAVVVVGLALWWWRAKARRASS